MSTSAWFVFGRSSATPLDWRRAVGLAVLVGLATAGCAAEEVPYRELEVGVGETGDVLLDTHPDTDLVYVATSQNELDTWFEREGIALADFSEEMVIWGFWGTCCTPYDPEYFEGVFESGSRVVLRLGDRREACVDSLVDTLDWCGGPFEVLLAIPSEYAEHRFRAR